MSSKTIQMKRRALTPDAQKGSPHSTLTSRSMKAHSTKKDPVSKRPLESAVVSARAAAASGPDIANKKCFKINLDKENNNIKSPAKDYDACLRQTPKSATRDHASRSCQVRVNTSKDTTKGDSAASHSPKTTPSALSRRHVSKSTSKTSCAALLLSTSTDALARRHRQSHGDENAVASSPAKGSQSLTKSAKRASPTKTKTGSVAESPKRKCLLLPPTGRNVVNSPSIKSIPSNMVSNMVKNIQDKSPVLSTPTGGPSPRLAKSGNRGTIRKNLASQFTPNESIKRQSMLKNLSRVDDNDVLPEDSSVTVAIRVRPFSQREMDLKAQQVVFVDGNETVVSDKGNKHSFVYDFSFDSTQNTPAKEFASQVTVYEKLARPLLSAAFNGYNTCLFAYGQTGSGKSYTIMGHNGDVGVVPRFCDEMFSGVKAVTSNDSSIRFHIEMSYFEIYNEKIHDLLVSNTEGVDDMTKKQALRVREHPETGPYVEGLSTFVVAKFEDIQSWLDVGNQRRVTASTGMNDKSSRSHSVFILNMTRTCVEDLEGERHESSRRSRINLVDLAGSERSSTAQTSGQRLKEGASINKSLLTLGKVISALSERSSMASKAKHRMFIPYRDSVLTWLLKESLGGNSRTAMIATVSPADCHSDETLSTLRYATQARSIVNLVKINEDPNAAIIRELKSEIAKLREAHRSPSVDLEQYQATVREVAQLRDKLAESEDAQAEANTQWRKKLEESEKRKAEEIGELKRAGVSFKVDNRLPNLVNLNEDPQLSELLLYVIKRGVTRVGRKGGPHECEIQLGGALIADLHCEIMNKDELVTVTPKDASAKIFVNGEMISKATVLHHSDRVVIAGDHFFRLNHPIEIQKKNQTKRNSGGQKKDFEFAKNELLAAQNARMEAEIEQTRLRVKQEMLQEIELAKKEAQQEITEHKNQYEQVVHTLQSKLEEDKSTKRKLEVIQEEKLILEKELDANRRRRDIEAKILSEKTVIDKRDLVRSHIITELEAERQKLAKDIERIGKSLQKKKEGKETPVSVAQNSKWTPLRVSILLEEANRISTELQKSTNFQRHDIEGSEVQIKVENKKLGIWTLWSMEKFEEKLDGMREAHNGFISRKSSCGSSNGDSDPEDNLFYDPADVWWQVFATSEPSETTTTKYPDDEGTPRSVNPRPSRRLSRRLSSLALVRTSPALQQSLLQLDQQSEPLRQGEDTSSILLICKDIVNGFATEFDEPNEAPIDLFLTSLDKLSTFSDEIAEPFSTPRGTRGESGQTAKSREAAISITSHLDRCLTSLKCMQHIASLADSGSVTKLLRKLFISGKKIAGHLAKLLQGCEGEIEQMVKESMYKIRCLVPNTAKYAGALSLAMGMNSSCLDEDRQHVLSHRLKTAFIQGGDSFLRKTISGGLVRIDGRADMVEDGNENKSLLLNSAATILRSCKGLQDSLREAEVRNILNSTIQSEMQQLSESSLLIRESELPAHYYSQYMQRTQSMMDAVTGLVEALDIYDTRLKVSGDVNSDFHTFEDCLRLPALRIAELCSAQSLLTANDSCLYGGQNTNNNSNNVSTCDLDEELERSCEGVQDAVTSFNDALLLIFGDARKSGGYSGRDSMFQYSDASIDTSVVQRKSRPTLNRTSSGARSVESFAIASSVKKWLELADHSLRASNCK